MRQNKIHEGLCDVSGVTHLKIRATQKNDEIKRNPGSAVIFFEKKVYTNLTKDTRVTSGKKEQRSLMHRPLILFGVLLILVGIAWPWLSKLPLGRLPGDIVVERENFRFYFPLATGLLVSVGLSLLLWWWFRK